MRSGANDLERIIETSSMQNGGEGKTGQDLWAETAVAPGSLRSGDYILGN